MATSTPSRTAIGVALATLTLGLITVLVALRWHPLMSFDASTTRQLNAAVRGTRWHRFFDVTSSVGQPRVPEIGLGLVALALAVRRRWRLAGWIAASLLLTAVGYSVVKPLVGRSRPELADQVAGWSYPSGHASEIGCAAALVIVLAWQYLRRGRVRTGMVVAAVLVAALVGSSRIFLAAHYPSDVVAGWLLGALVVLLLGGLLGVLSLQTPYADPRPLSTMPEHLQTLAVIVNPTKVDADVFRVKVAQAARAAGWDDPLWFETTVDDAGASMARAAVAAGADVVVAAGGDGTVRVVCTEMAGTGIPVGIVPIGTGNLLARNLGLPLGRDAAVEVALRGQDRAVDLVSVKGDGLESTRFAVMAGMGLDAAIMAGAADTLKRRMGWPAYVVAGMRHLRYPAVRVTISMDGAEPVQRRARTVLIGNVGSLTAGIPLLPDARIDDGVLDVVVIHPLRTLGWVSLLWRVLRRHPRTDERLDRFTGKAVVVTAATSTPRQLDGDIVGAGTEMQAEVEPGVLLVRVPR